MKRILVVLFICALASPVFASGGLSFTVATGPKFVAADFTEIRNESFAEVRVSFGDEWSVVPEARNKELANRLRFSIEGTTLVIKFTASLSVDRGDWARVLVTMPRLDGVVINGAGDVKVLDPVVSEKFRLEIAGRGDFQGAGQFTALLVDIVGSGHVAISGSASSVLVTSGGSGNAVFDFDADYFGLQAGGAGNVTLNGAAKRLSVSIAGSGQVMLDKARAQTADVSIGGSGNATVSVDGSLKYTLTDAGNLYVLGNGEVTGTRTGSGQVFRN